MASSSQSGTAPATAGPWSSTAIDAASHGAIAFCQIYYEAYDEPTRRASEIPQLFLPDAKIIWNGNPVLPDPASLAAFLAGVPLSRHDLQTLDCHPVAGALRVSSTWKPRHDSGVVEHHEDSASALHHSCPLDPSSGPAPDLILNVTGSVLHGPSVMSHTDNPNVSPQDHPRKFHEVFMLRAAEQGEGMQPKYAIRSSNFRFIG
ncbi:hypothetical protein JCM24511_01151 [Saitozyma sp. JCM 24511]|nr:hypothetical protein JCM24511_01151 [Saitozyma sp. JCM 24511]